MGRDRHESWCDAAESGIVHKPFACRIDNFSHTLVLPLCDLVGDEQGLVMAEKVGNVSARHSFEGNHYQLLQLVRNLVVSEYDGTYRLVCSIGVLECQHSVGATIKLWMGKPVDKEYVAA